ncbi:tRNA-adenosine deaminase [Cyclonatronum proteinivorum]|uniref:tRNA-specific adenosine deaminase n=2 Tax=Cyclonatronum proteinivorum TaxID=1457365 RepID=A0A345UK57_9BACT|nr:tRNA-adenosine deaminase [Cyclonatronum proteinivorum]
MRLALNEAQLAMQKGEIPVGAVVVHKNQVIGRGHNLVETLSDPTAHAEMQAITAACSTLNDKFLKECTLYVTLEPCPMCAGASVLARLKQICIGTLDSKTGACGTMMNVSSNQKLNHQVEIVHSILEEECSALLKLFFKGRR